MRQAAEIVSEGSSYMCLTNMPCVWDCYLRAVYAEWVEKDRPFYAIWCQTQSLDACSHFAPFWIPFEKKKNRGMDTWMILMLVVRLPASLSEVYIPTASTSALSWARSSTPLWSFPSPMLFMFQMPHLPFSFPWLSLCPLGLLYASSL